MALLIAFGSSYHSLPNGSASEIRVLRGTCVVGGKAAAEAGAVTHAAVRCSAWLGVAVIVLLVRVVVVEVEITYRAALGQTTHCVCVQCESGVVVGSGRRTP